MTHKLTRDFSRQATGCGKTHTVSGTKEDPGLIHKTMQELFRQIDESEAEWDTKVTVSFLEIYNELIRDLLSDDYPSCPRGGLSLREDEKNRVKVAGLAEKVPRSADDVLEHVLLGNSRRTCSPTHANAESSRSHAVLQVNISRRPKGGDEVDMAAGTVTTAISSATLSIIDLAGSERASATQNMGNRMKEGANINKSLLALGNCINALCMPPSKGGGQHIPYRDSKLTRLLKFSLGGNCRTVMIVCVSPCSVHLEDTGNTLKYANRAKNIVTKVSRNVNGVERNITQYLKAIEEKNATIAMLQAQLNEKTSERSVAEQRKADQARKEAEKVMSEMKSKTASYLPPMIAGASCRAMWDAAELRIEVLKKRVTDINSMERGAGPAELEEKSVLEKLIGREEQTYGKNNEVQTKLRDASTQSSFMDMLLRSMQEKKFDKLEESDVVNIRLEASLQKAESSKAQLEEREKAYRASIKMQAEAMAILFGAFVRHSTKVKSSALDVRESPAVAELLAEFAREADAITASLLGMKAAPMMSPARQTSPAYREKLFLPPSLPTASLPVANLGQPSRPNKRMSLAPMPGSAVKPSPSMRRIMGPSAARIASPVRAFFSPRKRSKPPTSSFMKPKSLGTEKKKVVWRDEAGDGTINDIRQDSGMQGLGSSEDDTPPATPTPAAETEETAWIDDSEDQLSGDVSMPSLVFKTNISAKPVAKEVPAIPEWKKNRLANRTALSQLMAVSEDSSFDSSPEPKFASKNARLTAMGGPIRPGRASLAPLRPAEPLQSSSAANSRPASASSRRTSVAGSTGPTKPKPFSFAVGNESMSTLTRPTATSAARTASASAGLNYPGSSMGPPSRRLSSAGPIRTEKKRSRTSLLPVLEDGDTSIGASHSKMLFSGLLSPSKKSSPRKASRRLSIKPPIPSQLATSAYVRPANQTPMTSNSPTVAPPTLRAAMPTLSSQSKAMPASLRRLPSMASMSGNDSDRDSARSATGAPVNGLAMRPLVHMKL